ncbi:hypothetical protein FALBO_10708 [Fusarium albosuccineum]|uniref:Uncharacterized protein n=1 Tax=Fusarium albosuccineum TaxID=1237068 RepID=A0A8H4L3Y1_9HYPO|nr:hypothetical protein FALBO_10708 [Fusarium albosuccineum]
MPLSRRRLLSSRKVQITYAARVWLWIMGDKSLRALPLSTGDTNSIKPKRSLGKLEGQSRTPDTQTAERTTAEREAHQQRNDAVEAQLASERIVASKRQLTSLEKEIEEQQRAAVLEAQNQRLEGTGEIQQKLNGRAEEVLGLEADLAQTKEESQQLKGTVAELEAEIQAMEDALEPQDRRHAPKGGNSKGTVARPDYPTLKRKAEDHLYTIGQPKKMKTANNTNLGLATLDFRSTPVFLTIVHNEVLRKASKGGLINPQHFDVGPEGHVDLSKFV